jgi:hypothetical protein
LFSSRAVTAAKPASFGVLMVPSLWEGLPDKEAITTAYAMVLQVPRDTVALVKALSVMMGYIVMLAYKLNAQKPFRWD